VIWKSSLRHHPKGTIIGTFAKLAASLMAVGSMRKNARCLPNRMEIVALSVGVVI
jgi:hypothetical protein